MKKYLLSSLLGVFALFGAFASADTVGNFTSNSEICSVSFNGSSYSESNLITHDCSFSDSSSYYYCISTNDYPYYVWGDSFGDDYILIDNSNYCFSVPSDGASSDSDLDFASDSDGMESKIINGTIYVSASLITYSSSAGGDSSGSLLPGGEGSLSGIITGLSTTLNEFIPYLVYVGLGVLGAVIGFFAIKWLMNRIRAKVLGTFSGGRRR